MDDTLLFMPPCCIDNKLPKAINQTPRNTLTFYTHGDVVVEKFYKAISYLLVDPHVFALTLPMLASDTCVFLLQCFERKWITSLILTTAKDQSEMLDRYLSEYRDRIIYAYHKDVDKSNSHMVLYNNKRAIILVGPMYERPYIRLSAYTVTFHVSYSLFNELDWGNPIRNILFPDLLHHRKLIRTMKEAKDTAGDGKKIKEKKKPSPFVGNNRSLHRSLTLFLNAQFPPYPQESLVASHGDHHNFGQME